MSENVFQHYRTGTFAAGVTGFSNITSAEVRWVRNDHNVTLHLPLITGTSNAATFTVTGIPASMLPTAAHVQCVAVADNGVDVFGSARLTAGSAVLTLGDTVASGGFTASGTKVLHSTSLTYLSIPPRSPNS